jgi:RNA polymerase sigma-70 factor (ECF subfamily)
MSATGGQASARSIAEATARKSYSKLVAYLAVQTRDVAAAEDALSDAFAKALSDWPKNGCPAHPEAWLLTVARRRAIDVARRQRRGAEINIQLQALAEQDSTQELEIPDRRLGLMFACTHPAIDRGIRAPLMLQVILGLNAATIALDTVLDAIYATYSEGWSDPVGTDLARRDLADEAVFLGTLLSELMPEEPEALGLLALMFHAEARRQARRTEKGEYVPLANQDPERWDKDLIEQAENILRQAGTIGKIGRFQLEAALQSAHVHRKITGTANWPAVLELYNALYELTHSPVVAVNRALAVAEVKGPLNALAILDELFESHRITEYQPYWAMRAELLTRIGDAEQASRAYEIAIGLERDPSVRDFLRKRQSAVTDAVLF